MSLIEGAFFCYMTLRRRVLGLNVSKDHWSFIFKGLDVREQIFLDL
jgi:hypothetical protein